MVVGFMRICPGLGTHVTIQYYVTTRIRLLEFQQKKNLIQTGLMYLGQ